MEKFNDISRLERDPFLPCPDILLGDQLICNEEKDNGGLLTLLVCLCTAGKSYDIYSGNRKRIYMVTRDLVPGPALPLNTHMTHNSVYLLQNYDVYPYISHRFMRRS